MNLFDLLINIREYAAYDDKQTGGALIKKTCGMSTTQYGKNTLYLLS